MQFGNDFAWRRLRIAFLFLCFVTIGISVQAQTQKKNPEKTTPGSPAQQSADSLATMLQQATDAIDKMDFGAALDPLQRYIAQRPDEPYPHFQLGYAYAGLKRPEEARQEFSRAIALDPKMAAAYRNLGLVLMDSDASAAAKAFLRAAELQPTESRPRFLAGYCLERAGQIPEAIAQYRAALGLSPKDYEAHFALGRALLRTKDAAGAEEQFREAVTSRGDASTARLGLASALLAEKKYEAASDAFAEYLKLNPGDAAAHFDRASALLNLNRFEEALAELDRSGAAGATPAEKLKMRGEILMRQEKWPEAGESLKQAASLSPQDPELAEWIGHVDIELREYPSAVRALQQAYGADPGSVDALRDLSNAFYLNENYSAALDAMDRLAKLETPKPGSWFVRAICYDKLSRKEEAIEAYQKFLDQDGGQHDTQDFQARHRILVLQRELGQTKKK